MSTLEAIAINGHELILDTSDEAIGKLSRLSKLKHGDRITEERLGPGTVQGVGPLPVASCCTAEGTLVLWVAMDVHEGKVCFFPNPDFALEKIQE